VHGNVSIHTARGHATLSGVQEARHAAVAVSEGGGDHPAAPSSYLAPKRPRRAYGDKVSTMAARSLQPQPGGGRGDGEVECSLAPLICHLGKSRAGATGAFVLSLRSW
jgi:hypothetical protein